MEQTRKVIIVSMVMWMILAVVTACGSKEPAAMVQGREYQETEVDSPLELSEGTAKSEESGEAKPQQAPEREVLDKEVEIPYGGEDFIKSVFEAGGGMVYLYGIKKDGSYFLGKMEAEGTVFEEIPVEVPDDMRIIDMYVDEWGNCHALWISVEEFTEGSERLNRITFQASYILKVNAEGDTEYMLDISDIIREERIRPYYFLVDREGDYYFDNEMEQEIIKLGPDGELDCRISCDGKLETIGCGKSGAVYCIYMDLDEMEERIGRLEGDTIEICETKLPSCRVGYKSMAPGTDTELLVYNTQGGIFACNPSQEEAELRKDAGRLPVYGQDVSMEGFVGDGRMCLVDEGEEKKIFYYIPAGK